MAWFDKKPWYLVAASALLAAIVSALIIWGAGDDLDMDSVLPGGTDEGGVTTLSGPSEGGDDATAVVILIAIPLVAALPLAMRMRRWAVYGAAATVSAFSLLTVTRLGILYLPSAALLALAARQVSRATEKLPAG